MEPVPEPWREVLVVEPVAVHTFYKGWKKFKDIGKLIVYEKNDGTHWGCINHGFTHQLVKESVFYKLVFESFTSYLKESMKGGFVALSFENGSPQLGEWENLLRKIGTLEDFGRALACPLTKKKIEYHCPDVDKKSIHHDGWCTPIYKWGGKVQDTVLDKTQRIFKGGSQHEDYAQKTKRWIRNSWAAFRVGVHDVKEKVSQKLHLQKDNKEGEAVVEHPQPDNAESTGKKGKKNKQNLPTEV